MLTSLSGIAAQHIHSTVEAMHPTLQKMRRTKRPRNTEDRVDLAKKALRQVVFSTLRYIGVQHMPTSRTRKSVLAWFLVFLTCMIPLSLTGGCRRETSSQSTGTQPGPDSPNPADLHASTAGELKRLILEADECKVVARDVPGMEKRLGGVEREELAEILEQCLSEGPSWTEGTEPSPPVQPYPDYAITLRNDDSTLQITWQGRLIQADALKFLDTEDLALYRHLATVLPAPDPLELGDPYTLFYYELVTTPELDDEMHVSLVLTRTILAGEKLGTVPDDAGEPWFEVVFYCLEGDSLGVCQCRVPVYEHGFLLNRQYYRLNDAGLRCARAVLDAPLVELE